MRRQGNVLQIKDQGKKKKKKKRKNTKKSEQEIRNLAEQKS